MESGKWKTENGKCIICPRKCGVPRGKGFCGAPADMEVASVCIHRGEEPPINPIVNVFFAHCNLQCIYCQNWQISKGERCKVKGERLSAEPTPQQKVKGERYSVEALAEEICALLPATGGMLGLVTAAHYSDHLPALIEAVRKKATTAPTVVYNSSGYESVEALRQMEGLVDIYLPDLKYMDTETAQAYSHAKDYPEVAIAALKEMKRQVGGGLKIADGTAYRGIIVRHLVLPGAVDNSKACLETLADIFDPFSLHLSLMAQYFPPREGLPQPLNRMLTAEEYNAVVEHADALGFTCGWQQELEANTNYRPDFDNSKNPFEK